MTYREIEAKMDNDVAEYKADIARRLGTDEPRPLKDGEAHCRGCNAPYPVPSNPKYRDGLCWDCAKYEEAEDHRFQKAMHTGIFEE